MDPVEEDLSSEFLFWLSNLPVDGVFVVLLFDVIALAIVVWGFRRRRRGLQQWWWPLPFALPVLMLALLASVNHQFGYYNTLGQLASSAPYATGPASLLSEPEGQYAEGVVISVTIPGTTSGVGIWPAMVYLPQQYFTEQTSRFPVVYLIPGTPGSANDWFDGGNAPQIAATSAENGHPVIIVSPTAGPSIIADTECVNGAQGNWDTYLSQDVPTWINGEGRTIGGREGQGIAGLSMGGFCAQMLGMRHPGVFSVTGNFSGFTIPTYDAGMAALFGPVANLQQTVDSYSCPWILTNQPQSRQTTNWLGVGVDDEADIQASQKQFVAQANGLGATAVQAVQAGGHSFYVWDDFLTEWLPWATGRLAAPADEKALATADERTDGSSAPK